MTTLYDITRTIRPSLAVWPGDTHFSTQQLLNKTTGHSVNLFTLTMSAHTGTHADAPLHYRESGEVPAQLPPEKYIGPTHVVTIAREHGGIVPADLDSLKLSSLQRLLIHTWVSDLPDDQWPDDFPYPTLELIDWLAEQGGVLLGVDMPSVDKFDSTDLPCHHRLYQHQIVNLETLCLKGVPDGEYELMALPLRLEGVCASPVRAVLRTLPG